MKTIGKEVVAEVIDVAFLHGVSVQKMNQMIAMKEVEAPAVRISTTRIWTSEQFARMTKKVKSGKAA